MHSIRQLSWIAVAVPVAIGASARVAPAQHGGVPPETPVFAAGLAVGRPAGRLPRGITSFGAATSGGWIYVLGGYVGEPHHYVTKDQSRDFYRINAFDHDDVEVLPNEERVQSVALVAHHGTLIRVGGMSIVDDETVSVDACERFDPVHRTWTALPSLPAPRSSHDAAVIGDRLVVVGGWALDSRREEAESRSWTNELWSLDLADPAATWQRHPQPFSRRALGAAVVEENLIVVGGMQDDGEVTSRVDVFDSARGEWSRGPDFPGFGFGVATAGDGGRVFASGMDGAMYAWRIGEPSWTHVATLTFPRFFHRLVAAPTGEIVALGGIGKNVRPRHVETIRLGETPVARAEVVAHWTIPAPGAAKNRQGIFLRGDGLYLFGGNNSVEQHDFEPRNFLREGWRVDLSTLAVTRAADYPMALQSMQTVTSRSARHGFAVGGFGHDGEVARTHAEAFRYEFENDAWSAAPGLPVPRSQFGLALHDHDLWIFGGLDYDPDRDRDDRFRHVTSVLRGRPDGDGGFVEVATIPTPRRAFAGAALDGCFYLVGGMRENFELVETCDVFAFDDGTWRPMAPPARPRLSGQLVALDGRLYLAGGVSPGAGDDLEPNTSIEVYDPQEDAWSVALDRLPVSPRQIQMMPYRGHLLVVTTQEADRSAAQLVLIRPPTSSTREVPLPN